MIAMILTPKVVHLMVVSTKQSGVTKRAKCSSLETKDELKMARQTYLGGLDDGNVKGKKYHMH